MPDPRPSRSLFRRHPENPIVGPGLYDWRLAVTFNPAVIHTRDRFWMLERAAGCLRPFICQIGVLTSEDGVHFTHASAQPVFTPAMCGSPYGSVQDPRVVAMDGRYWMTFAYRPYAWSSHPTGVGVPESQETDFPGVERASAAVDFTGSSNVIGGRPDNLTRIGLAVSDDLLRWEFFSWVSPATMDDRNGILFPEKIRGRYFLLRRPLQAGGYGSHLWYSTSDDLRHWTAPVELARAAFSWESHRIGGSTPPIATEYGWLVFYHAVEDEIPALRRVVYRMGAMILDRDNPARILYRCPHPLLEPETYYEKVGAYIPNVVFPTGVVVVGGIIHLYYGVCDTAIALATAPLQDVLEEVLPHPWPG